MAAVSATSLLLGGCSGEADSKKTQTNALIAEAKTLTPENIEGKANEISQNDYRMFRSLMAAGGLDDELGGAAQGDLALKRLMLKFRGQMLGTRSNLPRLIKIADGDVPGAIGVGTSFFVGLVTADPLITMSSKAEGSGGKIGGDSKDGSFAGTFDQGKMTSSTVFTDEIGGMKGRITTKIDMNICPKADGTITIDVLSDSSLTKVGGTASANVKATGKLTRTVTDDAEFGDFTSEIRVENAAFGGARGVNGGFVDYTEKLSTLAGGSSAINRTSSKATDGDADTARAAARFVQLLLFSLASKAEDAFKSGQCVKLEPTSDPAKRSGAKPKTSFAILAAPRSKIDGTPTGGLVAATLTGAGSLDPAGSKVPADAKFTYVAGEKDTKGSIAFEARSKRGIGKATLAFDTMNRAYLVNGGSPPMVVSGKACNLAEPFTLTNSTFKMDLSPTSERGGSYVWTGSFMGMGARGNGSYTVDLNAQGGTISVNGRGYAGGRSGSAAGRTFTLTPTEAC